MNNNSMLKYSILGFVLFFGTECKTGQTSCEEVQIKGFFIRKFKESEISTFLYNDKLRKEGKSYSIAIDRYQEKFFIPYDSAKSSYILDSLLSRNINFYDEQPFILPSSLSAVSIKRFCNREVVQDSSLNNFEVNNFFRTSSENKEDKFVYKIFLIEGTAFKTRIANTSQNRFYLTTPYRIKSNLEFVDVYFIDRIIKVEENYQADLFVKSWNLE